MSLLQDGHGVLWLATLDGLGAYDGHEVRTVKGLPVQGAVYSLVENRRGEILVGGARSILRFDGSSWSTTPAPGLTFDIHEDDDGTLIRIDAAAQLLSLDQEAEDHEGWQPFLLGDLGPAAEILGPAVELQNRQGELWLAGRHAIVKRGSHGFEKLPPVPEPISAFLARRDGSLVVGTLEESLFHLAPGAESWRRLEIPGWTGGWFRTLTEDRRGRLWAGGNNSGVAFGDVREPLDIWGPDQGLGRGGVLDILADREGSVWFALNGRGVHQWIGESWSHRNLWGSDRLDARLQVFGIKGMPDGRGFWAAVFGRGVWKWDGQELYEIPEGPFEDARVALEPRPGTLWVGARFGAWERDEAGRWRQLLELENGFVWDFEEGPDGEWWAATSANGIYRLENERWQPAEGLNEELPDRTVRDLLWRGDELWAGTMGGLAVFRNGKSVEVARPEDLPSSINGLLALGDEMWLVGVGGVSIVGSDGVRRLAQEDGLPGTTIYSVAADAQGTVWLGGSSGVARQRQDGSWKIFGTGNGLIEGECNHQALWPSRDGSIYVGTMASLAHFDGEMEALEEPELTLRWTKRPRGTLPADQRSVRLEWRSPWLLPRPIEYRIRVPRHDDEWLPPRRERFLQLDHLAAGGWRVEIATRFVGDQVWSEPVVAGWSVEPFWWETRSFAFLSLVATVAVIALVFRWRTRRLRRRAAKLERSVEEAIAELKVLSGLLPICSVCKKVRDDRGYWQQIERYIDQHSEAVFSHGLCPECVHEHYADYSGDADGDVINTDS